MSDERGSLGRASLELGAKTAPFRKNIDEAKSTGRGMVDVLEAIAEAGKIADRELGNVRMSPGQAAESRATAQEILDGVKNISSEARAAAIEIDRVRITEAQAEESRVAGDQIKENLDGIGDKADQTKRKLEETKLASSTIGGTTLPILGAAIGAGALLAPAAGPAMLGLLGAIPLLATTGAGALGTLMLAFKGVGAAIGGSKTAYDRLQPVQQQFVLDVRSLSGEFHHLQAIAGQDLFPGLDRALHSALSPGTLHLVAQAVGEFARALGDAGQAWGRYFGSSAFQQVAGPVLAAAARGIGDLSTVTLHLFDALAVLARAAIPFLNWLGDASVKGAKWLDTLVRSRDATGQLGSAMQQAEVSLRLVGGLVESAARAVFALGAALYPVSKIAVKDLTDALNWLTGVIDRNRAQIENIVGGALAALKTAIKDVVPIIGTLVRGVVDVTSKVGAWKLIFEALIALKVVATLTGWVNKTADFAGSVKLAAARVFSFGQTIASVVKAALVKLGLLKTAEIEVGTAAAAAETEAAGAFEGIGAAALAAIPEVAALAIAIGAVYAISRSGGKNIYGAGPGGYIDQTQQFRTKAGTVEYKDGKYYLDKTVNVGKFGTRGVVHPISAAEAAKLGVHINPPSATHDFHGAFASSHAYTAMQVADAAKQRFANLFRNMGGGSAFGSAPPFTGAGSGGGGSAGGGGSSHPAYHIPVALQDEIAKRWAKFSKDTTRHNEQLYLAAVDQAAKLANAHGQSVAPYVADLSKAQKLMQAKIAQVAAAQAKKTIEKLAEQTAGPEMTLKIATAAGAPTSVILSDQQTLLAAYQTEAAELKAKMAAATGKAKAEYKAALAKINQAIQSTQDAVVSSLQSIYQTAQQQLGTAASKMEQDVLSQFEAQTQAYITNTLGPEFFQGGALTPLEQQLADMQQQDQLQSLNDSLTQAQATGDPAQIAAAQRQLDEYNLSIQAAQQRAQADAAYATAVQTYTDQRAVEEAKLTTALDAWVQGVTDGTASINDLNGIADTFGVTLTGLSDPNTGIGYDFSLLQTAANNAATALANLTAAAGGANTGSTIAPSASGIDAIVAALANGSAIPMATGGAGTVSVPTLFLAGEAGREDYAFSGGGRSFHDLSGPMRASRIEVPVYLDKREIARAVADGVGSDRQATHTMAKAVKPALARVSSVGN